MMIVDPNATVSPTSLFAELVMLEVVQWPRARDWQVLRFLKSCTQDERMALARWNAAEGAQTADLPPHATPRPFAVLARLETLLQGPA